MVGTTFDESTLNQEELLLLWKTLSKHSAAPSENPTPSVSLAHEGIALTHILSSQTITNDLWIIDSGATNHITCLKELLSEFNDYSDHNHVEVTNGQFAKVLGSGTIIISENIILKYVLYVPKIKCSLLSVWQVTTHLKCLISFDNLGCVFQDLALLKYGMDFTTFKAPYQKSVLLLLWRLMK